MTLLGTFAARLRSFGQGKTGFATPDVSRVQGLAIGQAAVAVLLVLGFDLDDNAQELVLVIAATLGAALPISDAVVRQARAKNAEEIQAAREKNAALTDESQPPPSAGERRRLYELRDRLKRS